jgi:D-sedoheptulose 7-phosphate isomerase
MNYLNNLVDQINKLKLEKIKVLEGLIKQIYVKKKTIYICGNGGSAANANHITNDLMLGFGKYKKGFKFLSLNSNVAKLTCIANDLSYEKVFSHQLDILGNKGDLLIVLSGSGNSENILNVVKVAKKKNITSVGLIGYDGGKVKKILDYYIHFKINDMQVSEDLQMIVMNLVMKNIINSKFKF